LSQGYFRLMDYDLHVFFYEWLDGGEAWDTLRSEYWMIFALKMRKALG